MRRVVSATVLAAACAGAAGCWRRYRRPPPVPAGTVAPPLAFLGAENVPLLGFYLRLRAILTDPVGLAERCRRRYGDIFTIRIPFTLDLTYVTGPDAYRRILGLEPDHAQMGPVMARVPTVGFWFPRAGNDPDSLQQLLLGGRRLIAELLPAPRDMPAQVVTVTRRGSASWPGRVVEVSAELPPMIYEAAGRFFTGDRLWDEIGPEVTPLFRAIADGIDIPRAALAVTPLHRLMREYRATRRLERVLRAVIRRPHHQRHPLIQAIRRTRVGGHPLPEADVPWMLMYVLWNALTYPGSYAFWTMVDVLTHPPVLQRVHAEADRRRRLTYLAHCLDETIRLHPVGSLVRSLSRPLQLDHDGGRYTVPAGGLVGVLPYALNRDGARFAAPNRYDPDRYAAGRDPGVLAGQPSLFGRGPFGCVAQEFTRTLISTSLDDLLTRYQFTLLTLPPQRRCRVHLTYPARPLLARVDHRSADADDQAPNAASIA